VLVVVLENPDRFAIRLTEQISCGTSVSLRSRNPNAPRTSTTTRMRTIPNFGIWVKLMGKSLSSDSARARSQKQQKEAWRNAAPDARERIYRRRQSGSVLSFLRCANIFQGLDRRYDLKIRVDASSVNLDKAFLINPASSVLRSKDWSKSA